MLNTVELNEGYEYSVVDGYICINGESTGYTENDCSKIKQFGNTRLLIRKNDIITVGEYSSFRHLGHNIEDACISENNGYIAALIGGENGSHDIKLIKTGHDKYNVLHTFQIQEKIDSIEDFQVDELGEIKFKVTFDKKLEKEQKELIFSVTNYDKDLVNLLKS